MGCLDSMNFAWNPIFLAAFCTPSQANWLNALSFTPLVSVTKPTFIDEPADGEAAVAAGVVVAANAVVGVAEGEQAARSIVIVIITDTTRQRLFDILNSSFQIPVKH